MFTSLIRAWWERTSNPHRAAAGAKLHVTELEGRVNPSHAVDVPVAAAVPPAAAVGDTALVSFAAHHHQASAPTRAEARFEIKFMEGMIDHHMMAVMMSQLCQERAVHEELKALCGEMEEAQTAEIAQMQTWLKDWYGITYEPQMTRGMERQMEKLASLSGAAFEIKFMQMMTEHHEKAVKEGERCVERASHPELIEFCHDIVETQTEEIQTMQTWLGTWYGVD